MTTVVVATDDDIIAGDLEVLLDDDCFGVDENLAEQPLPNGEHLKRLCDEAADELMLFEPAKLVADGSEVQLTIKKMRNKDEATDWLNTFRATIGHDWNQLNVRPTAIYYMCAHASRGKNRNGPVKHPEWSKDRNCPAKMRINLKKPHSPFSVATVDVQHSHGLTLQQMALRKVSKKARDRFFGYFANGCTPSAAKKENFRYVQSAFGNDAVYDAAHCPTNNQIYFLWRSFVKTSAGGNSWAQVIKKVQDEEDKYREMGIQIRVSECPMVITVITPIMGRVHSTAEAAEMAFIDTTCNCDLFGAYVTPVIVRTAAGAFPVSVSISETITAASYAVMFKHSASVTGSFGGQGFPSIAMRDDCSKIAAALREVFPRTLQLVCSYHSLNSHWRFLMSEFSSEVDRSSAFQLLRNINCCPKAEDTELKCQQAFQHPLVVKSKGLQKRITKMWDNKESYIWAYRPQSIRGTHTNNYAEAQMLIIKDGALGRCKAINPFSLMNYVCADYEQIHQGRLMEFSRAGDHRPFNKSRFLRAKASELRETVVHCAQTATEDEMQIPSATRDDVVYNINLSSGLCDCPVGRFGGGCKHLAAIKMYTALPLTYDELTNNTTTYSRQQIDFLLTGCRKPLSVFTVHHMPHDTGCDEVEQLPIYPSVRSTDACASICSGQPHSEAASQSSTTNDQLPEEEDTSELLTALANTVQMKLANTSADTLRKCSKKITGMSETGLVNLILSDRKARRSSAGARIHTQSTAPSRRVHHLSKSRSAMPRGRPSQMALKLIDKAKKTNSRPHSLALNVNNNRYNWKKH